MGENTIKLRLSDLVKVSSTLAGDKNAVRYVRKLIYRRKLPFPTEKIGGRWYVELDRRMIPPEICEEVEARMNKVKKKVERKETDRKRKIIFYIPRSLCGKFRSYIRDNWSLFLVSLVDRNIREKYIVRKRLKIDIPEGVDKLVVNKHIGMAFLAYIFENYIREVNNGNSGASSFPPGGGETDFQASR
jgi:hypothetical protein